MPANTSSNFSFFHKTFPELEQLGILAERYVFSDPQSSLMKAGLLAESMIRVMIAQDNIRLPDRCDAVQRIDLLQRRDVLPPDVAAAFHLIRRVRNRAVHEGLALPARDCLQFLQITHSLCGWFFQTYGETSWKQQPFVPPAPDAPADTVQAAAPVVPPAPTAAPQGASVVVRKAAGKSAAAPKSARETTGSTAEGRDGARAVDAPGDTALATRAVQRAAQADPVPADERRKRAADAAGSRPVSEAETRLIIDDQLRAVGWTVDSGSLRHAHGARPIKGCNQAIAEWPTTSSEGARGFADYALFVGEKLVGLIEAKATHKDISAVLDHQCRDYARHIRQEDERYTLGQWRDCRVPFLFATNGRPYIRQFREKSGIWFQDVRDPANAPQALHGWMSPLNLEELLERDIALGNSNLDALPGSLLTDGRGLALRDYQVRAVQAAERAVQEGRQTILLAMATGTGKTRTVLGMMYRFLKSGRFRRILFLVDRNALGVQATNVFRDVKLEELLPLAEIYSIKDLEESTIDPETRVHVATVQGMVRRILSSADHAPRPAVGDYDLVIVDEAHRGYLLDREMGDEEELYRDQRDFQSKYRAVLDYFAAVKIGLTATPALQTTEIFGPPVFTYSYREAVIAGFLADYDAPHQIRTKLLEEGIHYRPGETVALLDPVTGDVTNSGELDDELDFDIDDFNRRVVNESFNRTVLEEVLADFNPLDRNDGKLLVYAVSDQHADMIARLAKEICAARGIDTDAVQKITGSIGSSTHIREAISRFRNEVLPSIVVTVDLLTTGIDVPAITRLLFLRRVRSRILFEQMLGRATRKCPDIGKDHFEVYDAVDLFSVLQPVTSIKPVAANPSLPFARLLGDLEQLADTEQDRPKLQFQLGQIVARLQRNRNFLAGKRAQAQGHRTPDQDDRDIMALNHLLDELQTLAPAQARAKLLASRDLLDRIQALVAEQRRIVISGEQDELVSHTRGYGKDQVRPEDYLEAFRQYVLNNRETIDALRIICTRPAELTGAQLKELHRILSLEGFTEQQLQTAVSQTSHSQMVVDIIGLIRSYAGGARLLGHRERIDAAMARLKSAHAFTERQLKWLDRMAGYLASESVLSVQTFDESPRFRDKGGFARLNREFDGQLASLVQELNTYLYDDGGLVA